MKRPAAILLLLPLFLAAAPLRLALVGEPAPLLDLLQAELSKEPSVALLERAQIARILQEQRLDPQRLSKTIPHLDLLAVFTRVPGRMVVFHARTGARLADFAWQGEALGHTRELLQELRAAIAKHDAPAPHCLAFAQVRSIQVDYRQRPRLEAWLARFERQLLQHESIRLLERAELGRVLDERYLTHLQFPLDASHHLLALEFETAGAEDDIQCRLRCTDSAGKLLFRLEARDLLHTPEAQAALLADALVRSLRLATLSAPNRRQEAARFFDISQNSPNPQERSRALRAAAALAPDNEIVRYLELTDEVLRRIACEPGTAQWFEGASAILAFARKFRQDFPDTRLDYLPNSAWHHFAVAAPRIRELIAFHEKRGQTEQADELRRAIPRLETLLREARALQHADCRRNAPKYTIDGKPAQLRRDWNSGNTCLDTIYFQYGLYLDETERLDAYLDELEKCLAPDATDRPIRYGQPPILFHLPWGALLAPERVPHFLRALERHPRLPALLAASPDRTARHTARLLAFTRRALEATPPAPVQDWCREFLVEDELPQRYRQASASRRNFIQRTLTLPPYRQIAERHALPADFAWQCLQRECAATPSTLPELLHAAIAAPRNESTLRALRECVRQADARGQRPREKAREEIPGLWHDLATAIWDWTNRTEEAPLLTPAQDALFREVNRPFRLEYGDLQSLLQTHGRLLLCQACRDGDGILLLLGRMQPFVANDEMLLASIHRDGTVSILLDPIPFPDEGHAPHFRHGRAVFSVFSLACTKEFIVFGGRGYYYLLDRHAARIRATIRIPTPAQPEIAITASRLFFLQPGGLLSTDLDGKDRRVHFDQQRLDRRTPLDHGGYATGLHALPDGGVCFLVRTPRQRRDQENPAVGEVWRCDATGALECVLSIRGFDAAHTFFDAGDGPLLAARRNREIVIFRLDTAAWRLQELARVPAPPPFRHSLHLFGGGIQSSSELRQFALSPRRLWIGGTAPACQDLRNAENSPMLWLPLTHTLLRAGDRLYFLRHDAWFAIPLADKKP